MHAVPYLTIPATDLAGRGVPTSLAMSLAAQAGRWRRLVDYRTDTRWYRLLERTEQYEVWLLSWLPGQGTDLHDHGPASGAPIVALTANADPWDAAEYLDAGMDAVVEKPIKPATLLSAMNAAVEARSAKRDKAVGGAAQAVS